MTYLVHPLDHFPRRGHSWIGMDGISLHAQDKGGLVDQSPDHTPTIFRSFSGVSWCALQDHTVAMPSRYGELERRGTFCVSDMSLNADVFNPPVGAEYPMQQHSFIIRAPKDFWVQPPELVNVEYLMTCRINRPLELATDSIENGFSPTRSPSC